MTELDYQLLALNKLHSISHMPWLTSADAYHKYVETYNYNPSAEYVVLYNKLLQENIDEQFYDSLDLLSKSDAITRIKVTKLHSNNTTNVLLQDMLITALE